jgi:hypothetical protein
MRESPDEVIDALLADLFLHARNCVRTFGDFHIAVDLSDPILPAIRRLLWEPVYRDFPWSRTRAWLVEEHDLPENEQRSAWLTGLIVEGSGMPPEQAHVIDARSPDGPTRYAHALREHLGWREKGQDRLDFVLLPQRRDGSWGGVIDSDHDDSLVLVAPEGKTGNGDGARTSRVAMSSRLVLASRFVAILACGSEGALGLRAWRDRFSVRRDGLLPTQDAAEVRWYVDYAAASL